MRRRKRGKYRKGCAFADVYPQTRSWTDSERISSPSVSLRLASGPTQRFNPLPKSHSDFSKGVICGSHIANGSGKGKRRNRRDRTANGKGPIRKRAGTKGSARILTGHADKQSRRTLCDSETKGQRTKRRRSPRESASCQKGCCVPNRRLHFCPHPGVHCSSNISGNEPRSLGHSSSGCIKHPSSATLNWSNYSRLPKVTTMPTWAACWIMA